MAEAEKFTQEIEEHGENSELVQEVNQNIPLFDLWTDKEGLVSNLEASKENVDSKISEKENEINRAIAEDWKTANTKLIEE